MLVILMTIPVLDKTLKLNIYQVHNLPTIPPGQEVEAIYQLENEYFAIGKHGMYVTLPTEQSVRTCLQTELAICLLEQALYPMKHITWCVYALFINDEECIKRDCKYCVTKVSGNQAVSLGGYLWAVSSVRQEQLQVRCLEETHVIEIQPPLQIVYLGNGCEGYSPSMFLPAKNEMAMLNIGSIRMNILMLDTCNVEQTKDVCMYIEEFILVDIWIHCCTKLN